MKAPLTQSEKKAFEYIKLQLMEGLSPTMREISSALGYSSPRSAQLLIQALVEKKFLARTQDKKLVLLKFEENDSRSVSTIQVPIIGYVACGSPILAEEHVEGYLRVSKSILGKGREHFILQAIGDSMDKAGIQEGDYLVIRKDSEAQTGDIVLAMIDDEATVKKFVKSGDGFLLIPVSSNPIHTPIVTDEATQILGKVVHVIGQNVWS
jgi:repressor LexA